MGIAMTTVHLLEGYGMLGYGKNLLDIGSSNLYTATANEIIDFVRRHNPSPRADLGEWAVKLAAGSGNDVSGTPLNQSFAGELFEAAGMGYTAIDIAVGYKTEVVDLNKQRLPNGMVHAFDSVVNIGTSEHILNQMNTFAAVHSACKMGGRMMHMVPSIGWVDHGYFCYTSRFFFDMAGYNEYDVIDMWFDGPAAYESVFATARQYQTYFPALSERLAKIGKVDRETLLDSLKIPMISLGLVFAKSTEKPFMGMVETSTSVGDIPSKVTNSYGL